MTTPLTDTRPSPPRREQEPLQSANGNRGTSRPASPWPRTSEALPQRRTNGAHDSPVLEPMSRTRPTAPADCEPGERPATPPPRSTPVPARPSTTRATTWTTTQATSGAGRRAHPSTATQATTLTTTWTGASAGVRGHASTARATAWTSTWTGASVGRRAHASTARPTAWTSTWTTTWTSSGVGRRAAARAGGTPGDGARVVVSSVPVIAVPSSEEERTRDGALLVLATSRTQALALAGSRTDLSVTITAP